VTNEIEQGATVARPLFFEYFSDPNTLTIDRQMMIGPYLLLSPVLEEGATTVKSYFPRDSSWYLSTTIISLTHSHSFFSQFL
jgi:alpha-glucosidase (family GH31 glycosyl hydrolase)